MTFVHHFLSLPSDLHEELSLIAERRGISLSDLLIESLVQNAEAHRECLLQSMPKTGWIDHNPTVPFF